MHNYKFIKVIFIFYFFFRENAYLQIFQSSLDFYFYYNMMNCAGVLKLQAYVLQHFWSPARGCGT